MEKNLNLKEKMLIPLSTVEQQNNYGGSVLGELWKVAKKIIKELSKDSYPPIM
jgi:hypothetical protein|nr:hypothetical protein [uncultured Prevotella sp.]